MAERGKLLYEEEIKERRAQAELNPNHIGIFVCFLVIITTWSVYGIKASEGVSTLWMGAGLIIALLVTIVALYLMDMLIRVEFTQYIPVKVYEKGILMPTTSFDRVLWRKKAFIHYNNLASIRLIKAHKQDKKDMLVATTKQRKRYPKRYDRNSKETKNILENIQKAFPQARIDVRE